MNVVCVHLRKEKDDSSAVEGKTATKQLAARENCSCECLQYFMYDSVFSVNSQHTHDARSRSLGGPAIRNNARQHTT